MTPDSVIDIFRQAILTTCLFVTILVLPGLAVGLLVAMFQAATQINEMSMSFVPKFLVTMLVLGLTGPWLLKLLISYTRNLFENIPNMIG